MKTASKKVVRGGGEFLGDKVAATIAKLNDDKNVKPKHAIDKNPRKVEEIYVLPKKRRNIYIINIYIYIYKNY